MKTLTPTIKDDQEYSWDDLIRDYGSQAKELRALVFEKINEGYTQFDIMKALEKLKP